MSRLKTKKTPKKTFPVILIIMILGLLLRLHFFVGFNWSDSPAYVDVIRRILTGLDMSYDNIMGVRLLTYYPATFFLWLFGINEYALALYPLLCSLGSIYLTYHIGKMMFNKEVGLLAAYLLSIFPLNIYYSTWILPDVPLAFYHALAAYLFIRREYFDKRNILYLLSGIIVGLSYLVRISGPFILFFICPVMIHKIIKTKKIEKGLVLFFIGILLIFIFETLFYWTVTGSPDPLFRIKSESFFWDDTAREDRFNTDPMFLPREMLRLSTDYRFLYQEKYHAHFGFFYYLIIPAIIYVFYRKDKKASLIAFWAVSLFLYLNFGTMNPVKYVPIHRLVRHSTIFTIPSLIILAYVLTKFLLKSRIRYQRFIAYSIIIIISTTSVFYTHHYVKRLNMETDDLREAYKILAGLKPRDIYVEPTARTHMNFHFKFKRMDSIKSIEFLENCHEIADSYVVLNVRKEFVFDENAKKIIPECFQNPPGYWVQLGKVKGDDMGRYDEFDPIIYYAPLIPS